MNFNGFIQSKKCCWIKHIDCSPKVYSHRLKKHSTTKFACTGNFSDTSWSAINDKISFSVVRDLQQIDICIALNCSDNIPSSWRRCLIRELIDARRVDRSVHCRCWIIRSRLIDGPSWRFSTIIAEINILFVIEIVNNNSANRTRLDGDIWAKKCDVFASI
jgi:hypothetical protein